MIGSGTSYPANAGFNSGTAVFLCWYWQIGDNESLWLPLVKQSYVTYRETKNRTMALQHHSAPGEAAAKAIWPSPESLYILISSKDKSHHQAPMDEGGEAGTETLLLFCASQRQHWAVRPLLPRRKCSVVEPCSSQMQDKHGLAHVFVQPSLSILHENFGWQITAIISPGTASLADFHKYHLKCKSEVWMWAFRTVMNILQTWCTPIPFLPTTQINLHRYVFEMPLTHGTVGWFPNPF